MTVKKETTPTTSNIGANIQNCTITNNAVVPTNEHTRASVVALAEAIGKLAVAIQQTAKALSGPESVSMGDGIYLENLKGS